MINSLKSQTVDGASEGMLPTTSCSLPSSSGISSVFVVPLVLTHRWFDETESAGKRVEYRKMTSHWAKLIWEKRDRITHVRFSRGYTKKQTSFRVTKIDIGPCPIDGWDGDFYRIHFEP